MALIKWRSSYATGVEKFDEQHEKLVGLINDMYEALRDKRGDQFVQKIIEELQFYTEEHFTIEEQEMETINYPLLDEHKEEHKRLISRVNSFYDQVRQGSGEISPEFYRFLREWLIKHIMENDMKYKAYFKKALETVAE